MKHLISRDHLSAAEEISLRTEFTFDKSWVEVPELTRIRFINFCTRSLLPSMWKMGGARNVWDLMVLIK